MLQKVLVLGTVIAAQLAIAATAEAALCKRIGMSDVAFGKPAATASAREKLDEYVPVRLKELGWTGKGKIRSRYDKTIDCSVYLDLGPVGTEYRCLVVGTFCAK